MMPPFEPMWSSVTEDWVDRLIPDGGKGLLGKAVYCRECEGRGYTRKSQSIWQACPSCYAGRCWVTTSTTTDAPLKVRPQDGPPKS
jgi:hypothetical protein